MEAKGNHSGSQCSEVHRHTDGTVTAVPVMGACLNMEGESWGITNRKKPHMGKGKVTTVSADVALKKGQPFLQGRCGES